jgi:hypothetical protein
MNSPQRTVRLVIPVPLPLPSRGVVERVISAGFALLIAAGIFLPAIPLRAQSEQPDATVQGANEPEDQPISDAVANTSGPHFTMANASLKMFAEHSTAGANIVTTSENGYAGTVQYTCKLISKVVTSYPAECGMYPASAPVAAYGKAAPVMLIFGKGTKLPTGVTLGSNAAGKPDSNAGRWAGAGSAVLACCLLFGVPARRRRWKSVLSIVLSLAAVGSFSACVTPAKMISTGVYTIKVTGTDSKDSTNTATAMIQIEVV